MKNIRLFALVFVVVMAFSAFSMTAFAEETTTATNTDTDTSTTTPTEPTTPVNPDAPVVSGDWTYKMLTETTVEITKYSGKATELTVPGKIDGKNVVSIASFAIRNNYYITSLIIPGSVETFNDDSVIGCINLESITVLSGNLKHFNIGYCYSLKTVVLPENIKTIGNFEQCAELENISIAQKNTALKSVDGVVYSADGKTLVKYPAGKISNRFVIPTGVTSVADYAFYEAGGNIKEIFVPAAVAKMGNNAFSGAYCEIHFEAAATPAGCAIAVKGLTCKYNQINVYAPTSVTSVQSTSAIKLTWNKVTGASGYALYWKDAKGKWIHLGNTAKTEVTLDKIKNTKLAPGTQYSFAVRSVVKTAAGFVGSVNYIAHNTATAPAATSKIISAQNDSAIKLQWAKVSGVSGYAVFYKNAEGWKHLGNTTSNTVTFKNLKPGTTYTFAIKSLLKFDGKIIQGGYKTYSATTTGLAVPAVTAKQTSSSELTFTWSRSKNASHYQVYYQVNGSDWMLLATYKHSESNTVKIGSLTKGVKITLAVRAVRVENNKIVARSGYKPVSVTMK